jgi:ferredoxin hydrogenase large subunit
MSYLKVNEKCNGCLACLQNCPANAIDVKDKGNQRKLLHNMARCARCANCWRVCPQQAIEFDSMFRNQWDDVSTLELTHCKVCGEPIYTSAMGATLEAKLGGAQEPVCDQHKHALALKIDAHFIGHKADPKT